jgi:hypothetical protein
MQTPFFGSGWLRTCGGYEQKRYGVGEFPEIPWNLSPIRGVVYIQEKMVAFVKKMLDAHL